MSFSRFIWLLALVATSAAVASAAESTWLSDWMNADSSRARVSVASVAETLYESEGRVRACLQLVKAKGCSCSGATMLTGAGSQAWCSSQIQLLDMGCCRADDDYSYPHHQQHGDMLFSDVQGLSVGTCTWQVSYSTDADEDLIQVRPGVWVRGTASFTCELNAEADKCGSPLCDGLSLTGFATIYRIDNSTAPVFTIGLVPPSSTTTPGGSTANTACTESPTTSTTPPISNQSELIGGIGLPTDLIGGLPNETPGVTPPGGGDPNDPNAIDNIGDPNNNGGTSPPTGGDSSGGSGTTLPGGGKNHGGGIGIIIGPPGGGKGGKGDGGKGKGHIGFRSPHEGPTSGGDTNSNSNNVVTGPPQQVVPVQARIAAAAAARVEVAQYGGSGGAAAAAAYYPVERLNVAVGSFFVTNARHSVRYSSGRMQYVSVLRQSPTAAPVADLPPNALVFKPLTMDLLFDTPDTAETM